MARGRAQVPRLLRLSRNHPALIRPPRVLTCLGTDGSPGRPPDLDAASQPLPRRLFEEEKYQDAPADARRHIRPEYQGWAHPTEPSVLRDSNDIVDRSVEEIQRIAGFAQEDADRPAQRAGHGPGPRGKRPHERGKQRCQPEIRDQKGVAGPLCAEDPHDTDERGQSYPRRGGRSLFLHAEDAPAPYTHEELMHVEDRVVRADREPRGHTTPIVRSCLAPNHEPQRRLQRGAEEQPSADRQGEPARSPDDGSGG